MNAKTFAYVSDTTSQTKVLRPEELSQHEYWGEDFAAGNCSFGVFEVDHSGKMWAFCSFGDDYWAKQGLKNGDEVYFEHTQTRRHMLMIYRGYVNRETWTPETLKGMKLRMATLK